MTFDLTAEKQALLELKNLADELKEKLLPQVLKNPEVPKSKLRRRFSLMLYYFLIPFGVLQDAIGSFLFSSTLFALIPSITSPVVIAVSVLYTVLDCILFFAFEVSFLKPALGLDIKTNELGSALDIYSQKLKATIEINALITNVRLIDTAPEFYHKHKNHALKCNQEITELKNKMGDDKESILKKILKWGVIGFGILSSIAGNYFMATSLLTAFCAPLLGTPIGWGIIVLSILGGLGFYYAMGATSMINLVNPDRMKFKELKTELEKFTPIDDRDFVKLDGLRQALEKQSAPKSDASTQTDFDDAPYHAPGLSFYPEAAPVQNLSAAESLELSYGSSVPQ
jgi:hypothetical protein